MKLTPLEPWIARKIGIERLARDALDAYQLERVRETLRLVRSRSRFCRQHLAHSPSDVATLDDLAQLPFTTADDIRAAPLAFVCVSQDDIHRVVTLDTSGTTGRPKRLFFTRDDQELTIDFFRIGMSTFTAPGDRVLILLPGETPGSVGDLLATALARLGAISIKHGPVRDAAATLNVMRRERINVMVGVPTHVLALARHPSAPSQPLKSILLTTDHVPNAIKRTVESAFHCAVYNHYGMTETGLGGGVECEARRGYHLREADLLYEIVDPATGEPLPDGESGEVVFTTLTRRGMPLIRYRTGDVSRFTPGDCPCGTRLKTLERITHRIGGRISLGTDHLTIADLDEAIFSIEEVLNFIVRVVDGETRDRLEVQVKMTTHAGEASIAAIRSAIEAIPVVRRALNAGVLEVAVVPTDVIAPSMAKRSLRDERLRS